jgi:hypothetical protein
MRKTRKLAIGLMLIAPGIVSTSAAAAVIPVATCPVTVEISERAPLDWRANEWRVFREEAARPWRPYAVILCWRTGADGCGGARDALHVVIARETPSRAGASGDPLGWFGYSETAGPGRLIVLGADAARRHLRRLFDEARPVGSIRAQSAAMLLARALGRTLAHELGHLLLRSRSHERTGLMRRSFTPDDLATDRPGQRFALAAEHERVMATRCGYAVSGSLARAALEP